MFKFPPPRPPHPKGIIQADCSSQTRDERPWLRSAPVIEVFATVAQAGAPERSHLLRVGALGALMSLFLGEDSPFPELVRSPRPGIGVSRGGDGEILSPVSSRRTYRSESPSPCTSSAEAIGVDGDGIESTTGLYGMARDSRQVCSCVCVSCVSTDAALPYPC